MSMFTPTNIEAPVRQRFDRPYVGWPYGGWQVQVQKHPTAVGSDSVRKGMGSDTLELQLGLVGPRSGQGRVQDWVHRDLGASSNFPHWEYQVPDYVGFNALYLKRRNYWLGPGNSWRGTFFGGTSLGNVATFANAGAVLAFGNPGEELAASTTIQPTSVPLADLKLHDQRGAGTTDLRSNSQKAGDDARSSRKWALFVGTDQRYIWKSVFIEGRKEAAHDITLVRHVYDIFAGFSVQLGKEHVFTYKHTRRSLEFRSSQPSVEKRHDIGQLAYELRF